MNFKHREKFVMQEVACLLDEPNFEATSDPYDGIDFVGDYYTLEVKTCYNSWSLTNIVTAAKLFSLVQRSRKLNKIPVMAFIMPNQDQIRVFIINDVSKFMRHYHESELPVSEGSKRNIMKPHFRPKIDASCFAKAANAIDPNYKLVKIVTSTDIIV